MSSRKVGPLFIVIEGETSAKAYTVKDALLRDRSPSGGLSEGGEGEKGTTRGKRGGKEVSLGFGFRLRPVIPRGLTRLRGTKVSFLWRV